MKIMPRSFHFAFHASPLPMCDDAAKSDREQPEIDRVSIMILNAVFIFSAPVIDWIHAAPCGMFFIFTFSVLKNQDLLEQSLLMKKRIFILPDH
ncbi:hypothetical protein HTS61_08840 [Escherichia coli]|nr:hypothetical protein [Escherichia coli]